MKKAVLKNHHLPQERNVYLPAQKAVQLKLLQLAADKNKSLLAQKCLRYHL